MPKMLPADIRKRIVEAAEARIWRQGLAATKIDEIAADVGIGKGSIYLFFENKEQIALSVAKRHKESILAEQRLVAQDDTLPYAERVRQVLKIPIYVAHRFSRRYPHARQMILDLYTHSPEKWHALRDDGISVLEDVLAAGRVNGCFEFGDARLTAETLKDMTSGFLPPQWWTGETAQFEQRVDAVIDLGLNAIARR